MKVAYNTNNSGGSWWLDDEDWFALERVGWVVEWVKDSESEWFHSPDGRFLGALATSAYREGLSLGKAINEWEVTVGQDRDELGCECCGPPHTFTLYDDHDNYVDSYFPVEDDYDDDEW